MSNLTVKFLQAIVGKGGVTFKCMQGSTNPTDIFSKLLQPIEHLKHCQAIGLVGFQE